MTLYAESAYNPKIIYGSSTFYFDDGTTRINITGLTYERTNRVSAFQIPGVAGQVILGEPIKNSLAINFEVEFSSSNLETFVARRKSLLTALCGGSNGKFDFYLRYENASNYYAFKNCACISSALPDGPQDYVIDDVVPLLRGSVSLISEDTDPTIVNLGETESGATEEETEDAIVTGSLALYASNSVVIQNANGDVKIRIAASTPAFDVNGEFSQDGHAYDGDYGASDSAATKVEAESFQIEGAITIQNTTGQTLAVLSANIPGVNVIGQIIEAL